MNVRTLQHTFTHPKGLLFATQFAQITLVVTSRAAFEDEHSKVLVQPSAAFTGHSPGEFPRRFSRYLLSRRHVFYRGLTMQCAVEHDERGRSNYDMCAVNPSRMSNTFDDVPLREIVDTIPNGKDCRLEIMNFNVKVRQKFLVLLRGY